MKEGMSYCCGGWRVLQIHRSHKKLVYGIDTALVMLPLSLSPFRPLSSSSLPFSSHTHLSSSISQVTAEQDQHQQNSRRKSSQLVALEYAELNLSNNLVSELSFTSNSHFKLIIFSFSLFFFFFVKFQDMGHVRIRQHVNPLSSSFSVCPFL